MTTVDPTAPGGSGAPGSPQQPSAAPGFATALDAAQQRLGAPVTLGEMVGLEPLAPEALERLDEGSPGRAVTAGAQSAAERSHPAVESARAYLGVPYRWGGTDPDTGLDCSGFVQRAFADIGVELPRVSADQARAGQPVASLEAARAGDLVYWSGGGKRANHIGLYLGDGKMMHAPRTGEVVKIDDVRATAPTAIRRVA